MATEVANETENEEVKVEDGIDGKISKAVNSAITNHLKRRDKSLEAMLDERFAALKSLSPSPSPGKPDGSNGASNGGNRSGKGDGVEGRGDDDTRQELEKLKAELKSQKQRAAEKEAYGEIRQALTGKIRPEAMETALKVLRADGLVKIGARDGSISIAHPDGDLDVSEGLAVWLKGEGQIFAAVPSARKPPVKGPNRGPHRPTGEEAQQMTPAQRTVASLARSGLSLE